MVIFIGILIIAVCFYLFYNQIYFRNLPQFDLNDGVDQINENYCLLDLRDFNVSYKTPVKCAYNIPSAYLKRYYAELPQKEILILTDDPRRVVPDVRFLKRKGYRVSGLLSYSDQKELLSIC